MGKYAQWRLFCHLPAHGKISRHFIKSNVFQTLLPIYYFFLLLRKEAKQIPFLKINANSLVIYLKKSAFSRQITRLYKWRGKRFVFQAQERGKICNLQWNGEFLSFLLLIGKLMRFDDVTIVMWYECWFLGRMCNFGHRKCYPNHDLHPRMKL